MIRSSKHTLKYCNKNKTNSLEQMFSDYKIDLEFYISLILSKKLPLKINLTSKDLPSNKITHSRWKTIIYKNASEIIRSNLQFTKNKVYKNYRKVYAKCIKDNKHQSFTNKKFSELNINYLKRIKINLNNVTINIDNRLFNIKHDAKYFDEFILLMLPYFKKNKKRAVQIKIPIKHHKQSNHLIQLNFKQLNNIKLTKSNNIFYITYVYKKIDKEKRTGGKQLGIDIGYKKLISDSTGNHYGVELNAIYDKLSKKKRGSTNFKDLIIHKNNLIRRTCNNLNLEEVKDLIVEDLKRVRDNSKIGHKTMNKMQYWAYKEVLSKLESLSQEEGFSLIKINPAYTSQTCSKCGIINKENRKGELYQCDCGLVMDADTNAAINILHRGVYNPSNQKSLIL